MSSIEFQRRDSVSVCEPMYYERPRFNLNKIDKAGICLRGYTGNDDDIASAPEVMFNYRASHSFPLNLFYTTLRRRAKKIDPRALTAQRLKRFESIFRKLRRRETMQLSQMQDIGGCRAIVNGVKQLGELVDAYKVRGYPLDTSKVNLIQYRLLEALFGWRALLCGEVRHSAKCEL